MTRDSGVDVRASAGLQTAPALKVVWDVIVQFTRVSARDVLDCRPLLCR